MKQLVFVTATDTNAGKTWCSLQLTKMLMQHDRSVRTLKPIVTGYHPKDNNSDIALLLQVQGLFDPDTINRYRFRMPAGPSIAANAEKSFIDLKQLNRWCKEQLQHVDNGIIEGVGGLMVPLNDQEMVIDWMSQLPLTHIVLCSELKLGCINHILLSLAAMQQRGLTPDFLVLNERINMLDAHHANAIAATLSAHIPADTQLLRTTANQPEALYEIL